MIARINENGNIKLKTDKIHYISYESENSEYELKEINNKKFIIIKDSDKDNILKSLTQYTKDIIIDEWTLVNSLIKLKEKLPYSEYYEIFEHGVCPDNQIFAKIEKNLTSNDINEVLLWCNKYGLPFLGEAGFEMEKIKSYKNFGFVNDFKTCIDNNICGFRIGCFLIGLHIIYKTAMCGSTINDINAGIDKEENKKIDKVSLENYIRKTTRTAQLHYEIGNFIDNKNLYTLQLYGDTLLSAAMYTLQLWICLPNDFLLKRCSLCNCHFIAKEPREKYCNTPCNKDVTSARKKRAHKNIN